MWLTMLPMGWTNSVPIFHEDVMKILQPEIPHVTQPYIDNVPVRGSASQYITEDGEAETIPENPGIQQFIWEHLQDVNRMVQRMKYCGGTFSGYKSKLCAPEIVVTGHWCTFEGRLPEQDHVIKVTSWGPCKDLTDVCTFIGTIRVCCMFIRNFAYQAHHLVKLTRKGAEWEFGEKQLAVMEDLKEVLVTSLALRPIDYHSEALVILGVDTSYIVIGSILSQCDLGNPKLRYVALFGLITLNERKARFSQLKLELYGLYWALWSWKLYLIGVRNLIVEVNAKYIKGMLANPDIAPSASIDWWILSILMFHFTLVHIPGMHHGPDGLSRWWPQPGYEEEQEDDFDDWVDQVNGFMHFVNMLPSQCLAIMAAPPMTCFIVTGNHNIQIDNDEGRDNTDNDNTRPVTPYSIVPRLDAAVAADKRMEKVRWWLETLEWPAAMTDMEYKSFMQYSTEFFISGNRLCWKDPQNCYSQDCQLFLILSAHDDVGHRGFYAMNSLLSNRYWWPMMSHDIGWFIRTCRLCQLRKTQQVSIPPVVATPTLSFQKSIWILCTSCHLPDTSILYRVVALLLIGQNGKCFTKNRLSCSQHLFFTTSSIIGGHC